MKKIFTTLCILLLLCIANNSFSQDIFRAIVQGKLENVNQLLAKDSSLVSQKNPRGFYPIHFAANFNQFEIAKSLAAYGADLNAKDTRGRMAAHFAASADGIEMLKWLAQKGLALDLKDDVGDSPLYYAVTGNADRAVEFLISEEVQLVFKTDKGFEILNSALINDYKTIIDAYFKSDFDIRQKTAVGSSLLFAACMNKNTTHLQFLLEQSLNPNEMNEFGLSPLFIAIQHENLDAIKVLLKNKVDLSLSNALGQNALDLAKEKNNQEIIKLLLSNNAKTQWSIQNFTAKYPDMQKPGLKAELFGEGYISTETFNERDVMFSPDMDEFYFSRSGGPTRMRMTVHLMNKYNKHWTLPSPASFSGKFNEAECFITQDNQNLYLISQRPPEGGDQPSSWEIWVADRIEKDWHNFRLMDTTNLKGCFYPSITNDGEILYTSATNDLFLGNLKNGKVENSIKLGPEINTEGGEYNAMISRNGDFIIFTSHGQQDHYGGGDLYISFRKEDNSWSQSINMGPEINTAFTEYCPNLSPDGKYFFFTSNKKGTEDIYWIDAQIIQQLKEKI